MKKFFFIILSFLSFFSLLLFTSYYLIGWEGHTNRRSKLVTAISPKLFKDLYINGISLDNIFSGEHLGSIVITTKKNVSLSIFDGSREIARGHNKGGENIYNKLADNQYVLMEGGKTSYTIQGSLRASANIDFELINQDGTVLKAPFDEGKLYSGYGYLNGAWTRIPEERILEEENFVINDKLKLEYDYIIIPYGVADQFGSVNFSLANYKVIKDSPRQFLFEQLYPWTLSIQVQGRRYNIQMSTFKNPPDFIYYPIK